MNSYNRGYNYDIDLGNGIASEASNILLGNFKILINSTLVFGAGTAQSIGVYAISPNLMAMPMVRGHGQVADLNVVQVLALCHHHADRVVHRNLYIFYYGEDDGQVGVPQSKKNYCDWINNYSDSYKHP